MLTALAALSPMAQAGFVSDTIGDGLQLLQRKELVSNQTLLMGLTVDDKYISYESADFLAFMVMTDIILSAPVIKGLMTFFTAKENSTKTTLIHARDSFAKAVLAIVLLKSAEHLKDANFSESTRKEMIQTISVAVLRALAAFSYICGQTDTGFGDVYRALKEKGVRSLLSDENLSLAAMLRQSANVILPLLSDSNIKEFVQLQLTPTNVLDRARRTETLEHEKAPLLQRVTNGIERAKNTYKSQGQHARVLWSDRDSSSASTSATDQNATRSLLSSLNGGRSCPERGVHFYSQEDIENPAQMSLDKLINADGALRHFAV